VKATCSLHNHSTLSDGELSPDQLLSYLADAGFNVIAITDHMNITMPWRIPDDVLFIHGIEWYSRRGYELVCLQPTAEPDRGRLDLSQTAVKWIAHPIYGFSDRAAMFADPHINIEYMLRVIENFRLDGYELYNAEDRHLTEKEVITLDEASIHTIHKYATDDFHVIGQEFKAWIEMDVPELSAEHVIKNLQTGNFKIKTDDMTEGEVKSVLKALEDAKTTPSVKWEPDE